MENLELAAINLENTKLTASLDTMRDKKKTLEACRKFESMLTKQMLNSMTQSLENGSFFGNVPGGDYYQDLFFSEVADKIAATGQMGLASTIYKQINVDEEQTSTALPLRTLPQETLERIRSKANSSRQQATIREKQAETSVKEKQLSLTGTLEERLEKLQSIIEKAAEKYQVGTHIIKSIIAQESYGNPNAVSPVGAKGLMQLMDATAKGLGVTNSFDIEENIMAGTKYLRQMLDRFGSIDLALAAYNAGPGSIEKHNGVPPYAETKNYIKRVKNFMSLLGGNND